MSLSLTVCPIKHYRGNELWLARDTLRLGDARDLLDAVEASRKAYPLPPGVEFMYYHDDGVKAETEDGCGEPLTYMQAGALAKVETTEPCGPWGSAVWAFLAALPPETPVVLWWH